MSTDSNETRSAVLDFRELRVDVLDAVAGRYRNVLAEVDLRLPSGGALGITGRSGGGKSTLALAISGLLPASARLAARSAYVFGRSLHLGNAAGGQASDLRHLSLRALRRSIQGRSFLISQDVRSTLIPYRNVRWHLNRAWRAVAHQPDPAAAEPKSNGRLGRWLAGTHRAERHAQTLKTLGYLGLQPTPRELGKLPLLLSTGECQRVQLGMARQAGLELLIADEPFTSVDHHIRRQLIRLLEESRDRGTSLVVITHDLGLLRELTDQVLVVCNGLVAESGPTKSVLDRATALHPHTRLLLDLSHRRHYDLPDSPAMDTQTAECAFANACNQVLPAMCGVVRPSWEEDKSGGHYRCERRRRGELDLPGLEANPGPSETARTAPAARNGLLESNSDHNSVLLHIENLGMRIGGRQIFDNWSLDVRRLDRLGLCAPSGSGKTMLSRIVMGLMNASAGHIEGEIVRFPEAARPWPGTRYVSRRRALWRQLQMLHQDTDLVFDPGAPVGESLVQACRASYPGFSASQAWRYAQRLFAQMHLPGEKLLSPPSQLSGGERRRAATARVLVILGYPHQTTPDGLDRLLVLDEPSVGVDVFLQAAMAKALLAAQQQLGLTYLVISHDIQFLQRFCSTVLGLDEESGRWSPITTLSPA